MMLRAFSKERTQEVSIDLYYISSKIHNNSILLEIFAIVPLNFVQTQYRYRTRYVINNKIRYYRRYFSMIDHLGNS